MSEIRVGKSANSAYQVPQQFPSIYREDGPNFVEFTRSFYRWIEEDGPGYKAKRLFEYGDVDDTLDELLPHFVKKYMHGLPVEKFGDKRFVIKHILDVYRSKGSLEGLKLLFRLLFAETPDVYVPSKDVLKASDGKWKVPRYLEVSKSAFNSSFAQQYVSGSESGATAIIEDFVTYRFRGREIYVMYVSNVIGEFEVNEKVLTDSVDIADSPYILGSMTSATVVDGVVNTSIGDRMGSVDGTGTGIGSLARISDVENDPDGTISFTLGNGGFGYFLDTPITVIGGALETEDGDYLLYTESGDAIDHSLGSGANLSIGSLSNTTTFSTSYTIFAPYETDSYSDATIIGFPILMTEDMEIIATESPTFEILVAEIPPGSVINDELTYAEWDAAVERTAGTIASIVVTNPGSGWISNPTVIVRNDYAAELFISDGLGGYWGDDAVISATIIIGLGFSSAVRIINSGFGYSSGDLVTFTNDVRTITATATLGGMGIGEGSWTGTEGMLNADKYIHDSYYYQEYSYDVMSSMSLNTYESIVKASYHPVGSEIFGTAITGGAINTSQTHQLEITQT